MKQGCNLKADLWACLVCDRYLTCPRVAALWRAWIHFIVREAVA